MPQLERFFARWQAEILAEEGYPTGLVWTTADDLLSALPKGPGLIVLVDDRDTALLVQAVEDLGYRPSAVLAAIGGASRGCVMTASDLQTAVMLREDVARRLEHRERGNTQGIGSPGDHPLSGRR